MTLSTELVLASQSPRRRQLLERIGLPFRVHVSPADEAIDLSLPPTTIVETLAVRKADSVAREYPTALTLAADTIVVHDGQVLNKPETPREARRMLQALSGTSHDVYTGLALMHPASERTAQATERTTVHFAALSDSEIDAYVATGRCMDKAGAYGIQDDWGALFVQGVEGDYYNVVGLPLHRLYVLLKDQFEHLFSLQ